MPIWTHWVSCKQSWYTHIMQPARGHQNKCCDSTCLVRLIFQSIFRGLLFYLYWHAFFFFMRAIRAKVSEIIRIVLVWSMRCIYTYTIYKLLYPFLFSAISLVERHLFPMHIEYYSSHIIIFTYQHFIAPKKILFLKIY